MKMNYSDKELLKQRLEGVLPTIDIAGYTYTVDLSSKLLLAEDDQSKLIRIDQLVVDKKGEHYLCFFHLPTREVVHLAMDITSLPKGVVMLEIPTEERLDPIGTARQYGLADTFMLDRYPIRKELKANVIPLSETGMPEMIKANIAKRSQMGRLMKKRQKGKGL